MIITTQEIREFLSILNNSYCLIYSLWLVIYFISSLTKEEKMKLATNEITQISKGTYKRGINPYRFIILVLYAVSVYYFFK